MKLSTLFLTLALSASIAISAQVRSPDADETQQPSTNAYTALKWDFGSAGRKIASSDTLTFVLDSALNTFVRTRDVGPKGRNQTGVNFYLPDSLVMCIEVARTDADTNTTTAWFQGSVNGGTYFTFPNVKTADTDLGIVTRGQYCYARRFVPGLYIKPQATVSTATDTNTVFSAILFTK